VGKAVLDKMVELGLWVQLATMTSFGGVFQIAQKEEQPDPAFAITDEALRSSSGTMPLYIEQEVSRRLPGV
jgi:hypothetical protein